MFPFGWIIGFFGGIAGVTILIIDSLREVGQEEAECSEKQGGCSDKRAVEIGVVYSLFMAGLVGYGFILDFFGCGVVGAVTTFFLVFIYIPFLGASWDDYEYRREKQEVVARKLCCPGA
jgi:hypothetical protein